MCGSVSQFLPYGSTAHLMRETPYHVTKRSAYAPDSQQGHVVHLFCSNHEIAQIRKTFEDQSGWIRCGMLHGDISQSLQAIFIAGWISRFGQSIGVDQQSVSNIQT